MKNLIFRTKWGIAVFAALTLTLSSIGNISAVMENEEDIRTSGEQNIRLEGQQDSLIYNEGAPMEPGMPDMADRKSKQPEYAPGQLIVKLKEGKTMQDIQALNTKYGVTQTAR